MGNGEVVRSIMLPVARSIGDAVCLVGICGKDHEQLKHTADQWGIGFFTTRWVDLFEKCNPELTIVALPNYLHLDACRIALQYRSNVLLEKPAVVSGSEGCRLLEILNEANTRIDVNMSLQFHGAFRGFSEAVREVIGPNLSQTNISYFVSKPSQKWYHVPEMSGGGIALNIGVHVFDLVHRVFGKFDKIQLHSVEGKSPYDVLSFSILAETSCVYGRIGWGQEENGIRVETFDMVNVVTLDVKDGKCTLQVNNRIISAGQFFPPFHENSSLHNFVRKLFLHPSEESNNIVAHLNLLSKVWVAEAAIKDWE